MENSKDYEEFLDGFKALAKQMEALNEQAYIAYKPLVDDICRRVATEKEVGWLLTWLLDFAGNDRMLGLYKQVCRAYWQKYPDRLPSTSWNIGNGMIPKASKAPSGNIC